MKEKKKKSIRIVDKSSVSYTFEHYTPATINRERKNKLKQDDKVNQNMKPIKDIKEQKRHKISSKKIKSLQGHSPVYE